MCKGSGLTTKIDCCILLPCLVKNGTICMPKLSTKVFFVAYWPFVHCIWLKHPVHCAPKGGFTFNKKRGGNIEGDTPLPLAYCVPPYFGLAYCVPPFFGLAYCTAYRLTTKTTIFGVSIYIKKIK